MKQLQLKLIDNWQRAWRFYCMHAMLASAIIGALIIVLPSTHLNVPQWVLGALVLIAAVSGIVGRLVKQDPSDAQRIENLKK